MDVNDFVLLKVVIIVSSYKFQKKFEKKSSARMASMDDLADSLASSFAVSNNPNDPSRPHPRFSQYKGRGDQVGTSTIIDNLINFPIHFTA
jgi:hypothetical protein